MMVGPGVSITSQVSWSLRCWCCCEGNGSQVFFLSFFFFFLVVQHPYLSFSYHKSVTQRPIIPDGTIAPSVSFVIMSFSIVQWG